MTGPGRKDPPEKEGLEAGSQSVLSCPYTTYIIRFLRSHRLSSLGAKTKSRRRRGTRLITASTDAPVPLCVESRGREAISAVPASKICQGKSTVNCIFCSKSCKKPQSSPSLPPQCAGCLAPSNESTRTAAKGNKLGKLKPSPSLSSPTLPPSPTSLESSNRPQLPHLFVPSPESCRKLKSSFPLSPPKTSLESSNRPHPQQA